MKNLNQNQIVFTKKKTPSKPKAIKFKMPAFKKVKGRVLILDETNSD